MNAEICLQKLKLIKVLAFATVDMNNNPQIRNISAIHYEKMHFIFLRRAVKISVVNCKITVVYRYWDTQNSRR